MFLLDANVFIYAQRDYYPPERVPEFWEWLAHQGEIGNVKVPLAIWEEVKPHDEILLQWMQANRDSLILDPDESDVLVHTVLDAYATDLTDDQLEQIGQDPFLIAAGLHYGATVVSKEGSKPSASRQNRRVPDICNELGIRCITDHKLIVELDFRTNWKIT